ncbi:SMI1/KNR4 family protein [Rossellomorea marisflavi]|uniref:SMI1/KNR4 family protein n=1 Tax=Rossellomorea marisflavi TaxID=189381 RepID=A0A5D4RUC5_9BACI|nr:SMI1/KNR4 family protein [Rossellomorea marisflavi]TYS54933.1 SMI1/KNR4 family protein [Rossellomorea marisflavi]
MRYKKGSIIHPLPNDLLLQDKEGKWRISLPDAYKDFIKRFNGVKPLDDCFTCNDRLYMIDRFLCIMRVTGESEEEYYDIGVVRTQLDERIVFDENVMGTELLPIAVLYAGDFVCLDYRHHRGGEPAVCVWDHEASSELNPVTYRVSSSFEGFLGMLSQ